MDYGQVLRLLRLANGSTQDEAAKLTGVPFRSWQNWESGVRSLPALKFQAIRQIVQSAGWLVSPMQTSDEQTARVPKELFAARNNAPDADLDLIDAQILHHALRGEIPAQRRGRAKYVEKEKV